MRRPPPTRRRFLSNTTGAAGALAFGVPRAHGDAEAQGAGVFAGYAVPGEESPHERTFMQWPVNREVYGDRAFLRATQRTIAEIANTIAAFEPVVMLAAEAEHDRARRLLGEGVVLWDVPTDDLWCRDAGPLFTKHSTRGLAVVDLHFNGWGGKQACGNDAVITSAVAERLGVPLLDSGLCGEPGGVEHDGAGTLIAHESSWVIGNRNPGRTRDEIETLLLAAYGARAMIWAPGVRGADITDYHIDALARYVEPGVVVIQMPDERHADPRDPWVAAAEETHDILSAARDARGERLELAVLDAPVQLRIDTEDFVGAYANYYVCNGGVIAAAFGDEEADAAAAATLAELYPGREVVTLNVDALGELGGGIHCATQQQPAV